MKINLTANKYIPIPENFILNVLPSINANVANIYIYSYTKLYVGDTITTSSVAKDLRLLESDVVSAFNELKELNVLSIDDDSIELVNGNFTNKDSNEKNVVSTKKKLVLETRPTYSNEEIKIYSESNEETHHLFLSAQENLGKLLTKNDYSIIFSFYDWLRMPLELIEFLIVYCSENGHTNVRYIEKIALDWHNNGINTLNKAKEYINRFSIYKKIFKAYGISLREPNQSETKIMDKWLFEYSFNFDIIEKACEKTISQTHKASLTYTDKILSDWLNKNVKNISDIEKMDEDFISNKQSNINSSKAKVSTKFNNFKHGEIDFDEIKKIKEKQLES